MDVRFYTFNKRENSTAAPSKTGGTLISCQLLDNTSFQNPRLRLRRDNTIFTYNYFYIPIYDRFYFRSDIESDHTDLIISGTVDPMASFRDAILGSSQYVVRSAAESDPFISDNAYPLRTDFRHTNVAHASPFSNSDLIFYLAVVNSNTSSKFGAVQYFKLTAAQLGSLLFFMLGDTTYLGTTSFADANYLKATVNPFQYIVDCWATPYTPVGGSIAEQPIKFGWWDSGLTAYTIDPAVDWSAIFQWPIASFNIELPRHPDAAPTSEDPAYKYYMYAEPYTRYTVYAGAFGEFNLDANHLAKFGDQCQIKIQVWGDFYGKTLMRIFDEDGNLMCEQYADAKIKIPIAQINNDPAGQWGAFAQMVSGVASAATGNVGGLLSAVGAVNTMTQAMTPKGQKSGIGGSLAALSMDIVITADFAIHATEGREEIGRPLYMTKTLSTLPGYNKVIDADVVMSGTPAERSKIISTLEKGFYVE